MLYRRVKCDLYEAEWRMYSSKMQLKRAGELQPPELCPVCYQLFLQHVIVLPILQIKYHINNISS